MIKENVLSMEGFNSALVFMPYSLALTQQCPLQGIALRNSGALLYRSTIDRNSQRKHRKSDYQELLTMFSVGFPIIESTE